mgnify:FL=1
MERRIESAAPADLIFAYTRSQALADGVLVDVSGIAAEAGIRFPVAVTAALWGEYIQVPNDDALHCQSVEGRLWDTLTLFRTVARNTGGDQLFFRVSYVMAGRKMVTPVLKAVCGPGDSGEPVITIMKQDED